ncbi:MAG TPA: SRPBCC family protein [Desulfomonilia bacterium]|nr:SRPBCC family protein [Desulfomonilia bacterium]
MARVHKNIEINAPVEKVFSYIEDPKNDTEWITNMVEVNDVTGSGVGKHFNWVWNMAGIKFKGESTYTEDIPNKRIAFISKGGIDAKWDFKFESKKNVTILDLDIEYSIPVPVLGKLAEKMILKHNERDADMALGNLKDRLES